MASKSAPKPKRNLSALKRVKQAEKARLRNQAAKTRIKTYIKRLDLLLPDKNKEEIERLLRETIKIISKAASRGIIHKNTASRKISRLTKKANTALAE